MKRRAELGRFWDKRRASQIEDEMQNLKWAVAGIKTDISPIKGQIDDIQHTLNAVKIYTDPIWDKPKRHTFGDVVSMVSNFVALGTLVIFGKILSTFGLGMSLTDVQKILLEMQIDVSPELLIDGIIVTGEVMFLSAISIWILYAVWSFFAFSFEGGFIAILIGPCIAAFAGVMMLSVFVFATISADILLQEKPSPAETKGQKIFSD